MIPFIDLKKQYRRIESQVDKAIKNVRENEEDAQVYDGSDTALAKQPWMVISNDPSQKIETKPEETEPSVPIFTLPPTDPSAPATTPSTPVTPSTPAASTPVGGNNQGGNNQGQTPAATNPQASTGNDQSTDETKNEGSSELILWIVVGVVAVGAIAAIVLIVIKRKKA